MENNYYTALIFIMIRIYSLNNLNIKIKRDFKFYVEYCTG